MLIVNADDWGRSVEETEAAFTCFSQGRVTSATAMVFMRDSERAAELARTRSLDVGLHLNLNQKFTGTAVSEVLCAAHERVAGFLNTGKYALILYHPLLRGHFRDVYQAQADEFLRLYSKPPSHVDGHQHVHLCSNVLLDGLIPPGQKVRRSFSFSSGEKNLLNRTYRRCVDSWLARSYRLTDYFFALDQRLEPHRLLEVAGLARSAAVELMTHPVRPQEFAFLTSDRFLEAFKGVQFGSYASL